MSALVLAASPVLGQVLRGTVVDSTSGKPVGGVRVIVSSALGARIGDAVTQSDGQFTFHLSAAGDYRVGASRLGYDTLLTEHIAVGSTSESNVLLRLAPRPVSLDTLSVVAAGAAGRLPSLAEVGFVRRKQTLYGFFLTRAEIEKYGSHSHYMTDVLRHLAGVKLVCNMWISCDVGSSIHCLPRVILDGKVVRLGGPDPEVWDYTLPEWLRPAPVTLDDLFEPSNIEALEVYPTAASVPIEWGGFANSCGAIIAWSRR